MNRKNGQQRMIEDIEREVAYTRQLIGRNHLDPRVMDAMREVPRDAFVPDHLKHAAFDNGPLPIGHGQTISQPFIVALMTDLLRTRPEHRVLEIGTGSGYQSAILSRLCKEVYSVEVVPELSSTAQRLFRELGYDNIHLKTGNGYEGWPEHAPYDGIIVTAAASHIPSPLIEQLKPGSRLVIPVGEPYSYQKLYLVEKDTGGNIKAREILGVSFVPLV
ncbi:protein-L-isoaspartate O-methyltransferase [Desulfolithobacter dissulfuricans]|uniref:Protein-L-isoaspartate O-methyltransferase n=1 Tax=Desulfolithobacter dissulfuricans TaxID=2795293 RepID=A0A915XLE3_9BACT|nr:protein-L-isoaspartate(D-aspartate) O-methyltransferase [Desulfolithobacter dissulfuricans]BCO10618.1 protein-L-isoaspartate O-methyltransferase [Desulfolithobacter dissulfuricans]